MLVPFSSQVCSFIVSNVSYQMVLSETGLTGEDVDLTYNLLGLVVSVAASAVLRVFGLAFGFVPEHKQVRHRESVLVARIKVLVIASDIPLD